MRPLLWSLMNKSYSHCPLGRELWNLMCSSSLSPSLSLSLSVCLFTAPLTDKPPKILFPSESQMSVIEMAIGKEACVTFIAGGFTFPDRSIQADSCQLLRFVLGLNVWCLANNPNGRLDTGYKSSIHHGSHRQKQADVHNRIPVTVS